MLCFSSLRYRFICVLLLRVRYAYNNTREMGPGLLVPVWLVLQQHSSSSSSWCVCVCIFVWERFCVCVSVTVCDFSSLTVRAAFGPNIIGFWSHSHFWRPSRPLKQMCIPRSLNYTTTLCQYLSSRRHCYFLIWPLVAHKFLVHPYDRGPCACTPYHYATEMINLQINIIFPI